MSTGPEKRLTVAEKIERLLNHLRENEVLPDTKDLRAAIDCDREYREFCYLLIYEALSPKHCGNYVFDFVEDTLCELLDITEACASQMREIPSFMHEEDK